MRYWVDHRQIISDPARFVAADSSTFGNVIEGVCWFVAHFRTYLRSGINFRGAAFEDDFMEVARDIRDPDRRKQFKIRVLTALRTLIQDRKSDDEALKKKLLKWFDKWGGDLLLKTAAETP